MAKGIKVIIGLGMMLGMAYIALALVPFRDPI